MRIDPAVTPIRDIYQTLIALITPRPIAWVSTLSPRGVVNLAPFSFFMGVGSNPPAVAFSEVNRRDGSVKDTICNLEQSPDLCISIVSHDLAEPMNATSAELAYEVDELAAAGLQAVPSVVVAPPRVGQARAHLECRLEHLIRVGTGPLAADLVVARVLLIDIADDVLDAAGKIDPRRLDTIGRMGADLYCRTTDLFALPRPGAKG